MTTPHSDETRLLPCEVCNSDAIRGGRYARCSNPSCAAFNIGYIDSVWNRRNVKPSYTPPPPAQPSGLSKGDRSAIESVLALLKNDDRCPAIRHALELLESMGNAVKFADKRFAERGIELTALQHDIAKANRQLTAAQADLLNVRAELERVKTLTLVGLMDRIAKADAELAKACIQNGMLRDKNLSVLDFDNEMARTKLSLSTARTRIAELEEMHRGAVARCREQEIAKDGNQKLVTGTEFGEMFKQVKAERDSLYANTKLIEANAVKIDAKCSHWEKQCTDARSSRDAIKAELEKCREALKAAYVENQNLHCVMRGNQKSFAALERQTTILRAALTPPKEGGQS